MIGNIKGKNITEKSDFSNANGCLTMFLLIMLCTIAVERAKVVKQEREINTKILEVFEKNSGKNTAIPSIILLKPGEESLLDATDKDTLKIGNHKIIYVPVLRQIQKQNGR